MFGKLNKYYYLRYYKLKSNQMEKTNNPNIDKFLDDDYQSKGYIKAHQLIQNLRATTFKKFNDKQLLVFKKTLANAFDMTLK